MAYIYEITNDINNKIYVGKTNRSIETRFQEHCRDSRKESENMRPLYSAMRKYGVEHFHVSLLEETDIPEEREIYWIELLGSFKYGYNATKGGDGKPYADYDLIFSLWNQGKTALEISKITEYDTQTIRNALDRHQVSAEVRHQRQIQLLSIPILQLDKDTNEIIRIYPSSEEANRALGKQSSGHITAVCKGKRKTAYGYKWQYA